MSRHAGHVAGPACIGGVKCNPVAVPVQPEKTTNLINATRLVHTSGDGLLQRPTMLTKKNNVSVFIICVKTLSETTEPKMSTINNTKTLH